MGVAPDQKAHAKGMLSLFERYAQDGRARLTSSNFHEANKEHGIWQFIKGPLRVFCFIDPDGGLVVLSHGAVKKSQKADPQEVSQAIRLKDSYLNAKKANSIEWI